MLRVIKYYCGVVLALAAQLTLVASLNAAPLTGYPPTSDQAVIIENLKTRYDAITERFRMVGKITNTHNMSATLANRLLGAKIEIDAGVNREGRLQPVQSAFTIKMPRRLHLGTEDLAVGALIAAGFNRFPGSNILNFDFVGVVDSGDLQDDLETIRITTISENQSRSGGAPDYWSGTITDLEEYFNANSFEGAGYALIYPTAEGEASELGNCAEGLDIMIYALENCVTRLNDCTGGDVSAADLIPAVEPKGNLLDTCNALVESIIQLDEQCETDVVACKSARGDFDGDGVGDAEDTCPSTRPGDQVNSDGCSQFQFCLSITDRRKCEKADFTAIGEDARRITIRDACDWKRSNTCESKGRN